MSTDPPYDDDSESFSTSTTRRDPPPPAPRPETGGSAYDKKYIEAMDAWVGRNRDYFENIVWSRYPQLPVLSRLWGYSDGDFRDRAVSVLCLYTSEAGRRLTDEEKDVILHPIARGQVGGHYDRPIFLGITATLMNRAWHKSWMQLQFQQASGMAPTGSRAATFFRRLGRPSLTGLSCFAAYKITAPLFRDLYFGYATMDGIETEPRLAKMLDDIAENEEKNTRNL